MIRARARTIRALPIAALLCLVAGSLSLAGYLLEEPDVRAYRRADRCPSGQAAPAPACYALIRATITGVARVDPVIGRGAGLELQLSAIPQRVRVSQAAAAVPVGKEVSVRLWREEPVLVWIDGQPVETARHPLRRQRAWRLGTIPLALGLVLLSAHNLLPFLPIGARVRSGTPPVRVREGR